MMPSQPTLTGQRVVLRPLSHAHADPLVTAVSDGELWESKVSIVPRAGTMREYIAHALEGRSAGSIWPFVISVRETDQVVGSTRFWKIDRTNRKLEIGHTWLAASFQRSFVNTEAKYLLLRYAFEVLECVRVQFTTDELNDRSRQAILRIGATQEGIVRHERIMPDGRKRNYVRFSLIDTEWPDVRTRFEGMLNSTPTFLVSDVPDLQR
jgi:RimJ/RimL family protein N-acetyltransferase